MWRRAFVTILFFSIYMILAMPLNAQQKPFTQDQITKMVQAGLGDDSGSMLIEQRGIDFVPSDDFLQTLKTAGASEAFLNALRTAKPPEPASAKKPINQVQVFALLVGQVPGHRVSILVQERGIDFDPTDDYLQEIRLAGGEDELISALKSAKVRKRLRIDPAAQARQAKVQQHLERGAELASQEKYAEAEQEYRAALLSDPRDADVYVILATALLAQKKWDETISAEAEALRLDPNNELAHDGLVLAHSGKGDLLADKGEWDGAVAEYKEALRLKPNDNLAHDGLFLAHLRKGDWFEHRREWDEAIGEYREALSLNPNNDHAQGVLGLAHARKALWLMDKRDWDDAMAELREAQKLTPKDAFVHNCTGFALESKGDVRGALEEYRMASTLEPMNTQFRKDYERLVSQVNR